MSRRGFGLTRGMGLGDARSDWDLPAPIVPPAHASAAQQFSEDDDKDHKMEESSSPMDTSTNEVPNKKVELDRTRIQTPPGFQSFRSINDNKQKHQQQLPLPSTLPTYTNHPELSHPPPATDDDAATAPSRPANKRPYSKAIERPSNSNAQQQQHSSVVSVSTKSSQSTTTSNTTGSSAASTLSGSALQYPAAFQGGTTAIGGSELFPQSTIGMDRTGTTVLPYHDDPSVISRITGVTSLNASLDHAPTATATAAAAAPPQQSSQPQQQQIPDPNYKVVPKAELHVVYGRVFGKVISSANYHTWHDSGQAHNLQWTSIFVCPATGELYFSGRYPGAVARTMGDSNGLLWFSKKTAAEHAAAARALDCWSYREKLRNNSSNASQIVAVGSEAPYLEQQAIFRLPPSVPEPQREAIRKLQAEIRRVNDLAPLAP